MKLLFFVCLATLTFFIKVSPVWAQSVVLNEFIAHPSSGNDWVEIYNPTASAVDLSGWTLVDTTSVMKNLSGNISPGGLITFDVTNRLNNSGDTIYLKDTTSKTIDSYTYNFDPGLDQSIGRSPDGGGWTTLMTATKGTPNSPSLVTPSPTVSPPTSLPQTTSPTSSPTSSSTTGPNLVVSSVPSRVSVEEEFSVSVNIADFSPNTKYYLKGAFRKGSSTNYFGQTKVAGVWIKNNQSYTEQLSITTDSAGNSNGTLTVKGDVDDSGFVGTGDYSFKIGYYRDSSSVAWSNEVIVNLTSPPSPTPSLQATDKKVVQQKATPKPKIVALPLTILGTASAQTTPSPTSTQTKIGSMTAINLLLISLGIIAVLVGILIATFLFKRRFK